MVVLGLGRFGQAVAQELTRLGHDVLAIDSNEQVVESQADVVTHAVQADVTDAEALQELGLADYDAAIVAISSHLEASVLATVLLKRLGIKRIVAKAANELHGSILEQIGAHHVVYPEREMGFRVAHSFAAPAVRDYLDVAPGYGIARVAALDEWVGRSLGQIDVQGTCGVSVIALYRGDTVSLHPPASEVLRAGDQLIMAGRDEDLERLPTSRG